MAVTKQVQFHFVGAGTDWQDVMLRTALTYSGNCNIGSGFPGSFLQRICKLILKPKEKLFFIAHKSRIYNIRLKSDFSFLDNRLIIGESLIVRLSQGEGNINQDTIGEIIRFPAVVPLFRSYHGTGFRTSADINPNPYAY